MTLSTANESPAAPSHWWGYLQREALYFSWAMMDAALITPLTLSFLEWARYWSGWTIFLWLLLIQLLAFNFVRLLSAARVPAAKQRIFAAAALFLTLTLTMRTLLYPPSSLFDFGWLAGFYNNLAEPDNLLWVRDLIVFGLTILMWWRGLRLATRSFSMDRAGLRLRVGTLFFVLPAFMYGASRVNETVVPFVLLFYLMGLTAVALIRAEQVEQEHSGQSASLRPAWLSFIFAAAMGTVLTAGFITAVVSGNSAMLLSKWAAPLRTALLLAGYSIGYTLVYLFTPALNLLALFIDTLALWLQNLAARMGIEVPEIAARGTPEFGDEAEAAIEAIEIVTAAPNAKLIAILIIIAATLLVTLALGRLFRQATIAARENAAARGAGADDRPQPQNLRDRILQRLGLLRNWKTAVSIRRIYQQMSQHAANFGHPRAASETPYEYQTALTKLWPQNTADTNQITHAYVNARYGEFPETEQELNEIKQAWSRLNAIKPDENKTAVTLKNNAL